MPDATQTRPAVSQSAEGRGRCVPMRDGGERRDRHTLLSYSVLLTPTIYTVYTAPYTVVWSSVPPRSAARYVTTGDRGGSGCTKAGRAQALGVPLNS